MLCPLYSLVLALKFLRFQTNFKGGSGKGLAKGSRRGGLAAGGAGEGGKDGKAETVERHERSFDQGASVMMILQLFGSILILTIIIVIIASAALSQSPSSSSSSSLSSLFLLWSSSAGSSDDQSKYGSPSGADEANVDLHNKVQPSS